MARLFPGLRKVRNQAYRKLARVLDLEGTIHAGTVDISSVFLTHDLAHVVQSSAVREFTAGLRFPVALSTVATATLRPWVPSDFDRYVVDDRPDLGDGDVPPEQDADWIITNFATWIQSGNVSDIDLNVLETSGGYDGTGITRARITSNLNQRDSPTNSLIPAAGTEYFMRPMPVMGRFWDSPVWRVVTGAGGGVTISGVMFGFYAPKGVIRLPYGS